MKARIVKLCKHGNSEPKCPKCKAKGEGFGAYRLLGYKRHSKRSLWGHYFRKGKCLDCGLTEIEWMERVEPISGKSSQATGDEPAACRRIEAR